RWRQAADAAADDLETPDARHIEIARIGRQGRPAVRGRGNRIIGAAIAARGNHENVGTTEVGPADRLVSIDDVERAVSGDMELRLEGGGRGSGWKFADIVPGDREYLGAGIEIVPDMIAAG